MKQSPVIKQERPYWCGPACLQLLARHGPLKAMRCRRQAFFAKLAGTTTDGTGIPGLKRALKAMGFGFQPVHGIMDPTKSWPSDMGIVYDHINDHWMVMGRFGTNVVFYDPDTGLMGGDQKKLIGQKQSYCLFVYAAPDLSQFCSL